MKQPKEWLNRCSACGFESSTLTSGAGRGVDGLEKLRKQNFKKLIQNIEKHKKLEHLKCLEIGCAEGWFLEAMKERGAEISAVEASDQAIARKEEGYDVIHGFFPDALPEENRYDLIIFNDVFEHLPEVINSLKACEKHLYDGGLLIINIPNSRGAIYRISKWLDKFGTSKPFERLWQKDFPSPHMSYFSDKNMPNFVTRYSGLKKLDQFYLPSLSQSGLSDRIKASYTGIVGKIIFVGLTLSLPLFKLLPKDIMVFVFKKS